MQGMRKAKDNGVTFTKLHLFHQKSLLSECPCMKTKWWSQWFFFFLFFSNDLAKSIGNSTPELFGGILVYEIQKLGTPAVEKPNSAGY